MVTKKYMDALIDASKNISQLGEGGVQALITAAGATEDSEKANLRFAQKFIKNT